MSVPVKTWLIVELRGKWHQRRMNRHALLWERHRSGLVDNARHAASAIGVEFDAEASAEVAQGWSPYLLPKAYAGEPLTVRNRLG